MKDTAKTALEGSIQKWRKIVDGDGFDLGRKNCPLCAEFLNYEQSTESHCLQCPVMLKEGRPHCTGTPYTEWADHQDLEHGAELNWRVHDLCRRCVVLSLAELTFLEGLRDTD